MAVCRHRRPGSGLSRIERFSDTRPTGPAILISGRRPLPEKRVEKPACPTTPAPPFPVRSRGDADPGRHRRSRPGRPARPRAAEPDRRADRLRPGVDFRADPGPADPRLAEAGCIRIFADKLSGKTADRPELAACLDYLRAGDTLVVPSLDRLSRSLADLITIVAGLRRGGAGFRSLHEALDTTTPGGRLVFHVFAALAEFIRELIAEGTREGLDAARARGQRLGLPRR